MTSTSDYLDFMDRFLRGEAPTEGQFLRHFEHQNGMPVDAIPVGSRAPSVTLLDQDGVARTIDELMGPRGLLLAFVRSTYWCPYCRNQLAELNQRAGAAAAAGLGVAVVAPDAVDRNAEFAAKHGVTFPILSDPEGAAIIAYGVHNDAIPPNDLQGHGPLPHPGFFLLGPDRTVVAREFTGDIRHRVSISAVIAEVSPDLAAGDDPIGGVEVATSELRARISLTAPTIFGGQETGVTLRVAIEPGVHVYADGAPPPYRPFAVEFSSADGLIAHQRFTYPASTPFSLVGEPTLPVFEGEVVAHGRIRLRWSPPRSPFEELAGLVERHAIEPGTYDLHGVIQYQACNATECFPPRSIAFTLPIQVAPQAAAGSQVQLGRTIIPQADESATASAE